MHPALLFASFASFASAAPLLPDLVPWAKDGAYLQDVVIDTTEIPGKKLLRFSGAYANKGKGPIELYGIVEPDGHTRAIQRVYNDDGTWQDYPAGEFEFAGHASHNHFHFADFAEYRLLAWAPGDRLGPVLTVSEKVGYAMFDVDDYDLTLPGAPPSGVYFRPGPGDPPGQAQGISVGWADVYLRDLDEQWVDVTGLPDGVYWLEKTVDPRNLLKQSNAANDRLWAKVTISGNSASATGEQPQTGPAAPPPPPPGPPPVVASNGLGSVRVFPNPLRPAQGQAAMTFTGLPAGASLKVYTLAGELVRELAANAAGTALWDGRNASGASAASGVYFVLAQSGGEDRTLKVAVQR